jgi:predicted branched-subunit amino acid permease
MIPLFDIINPAANIDPYLSNFTNISNNTFYKIVHVFIDKLGSEVFFSLMFIFLIIGAYIQSEGNQLTALSLILVFTVVCSLLLSSIMAIIFSIFIAILITNILYETWVKR